MQILLGLADFSENTVAVTLHDNSYGENKPMPSTQ